MFNFVGLVLIQIFLFIIFMKKEKILFYLQQKLHKEEMFKTNETDLIKDFNEKIERIKTETNILENFLKELIVEQKAKTNLKKENELILEKYYKLMKTKEFINNYFNHLEKTLNTPNNIDQLNKLAIKKFHQLNELTIKKLIQVNLSKSSI